MWKTALLILALVILPILTHAETPNAGAGADAAVAGIQPANTVALAEDAAVQEEMSYFDEFRNMMVKGGTVMWILLVLSIVGIGYAIERFINLSRKRIATPGLADKAHELFVEERYTEIHDLCKQDKSALSRIILAIVEHRNCSVDDIQNIAGDTGARVFRSQSQKAYPLAVIATIAPLLGLLGTIIGMVGAFSTVATVGQMGDASILADDISKALLTTAGGLVVAIPMLGAYHFFRYRNNSFALIVEEEVSELVSSWFLRRPEITEEETMDELAVSEMEYQFQGQQ